jgi:CubicO group peptidase (beta-lactamase class C family)
MILITLAACGEVPVDGVGAVEDPRFRATLSDLESEMARYDVPGASIAIVEGGRLTAAAGVGRKARGSEDAVKTTTLFRVASLSKMILASAMLRLVEQGRLDLARPISDYVPLPLQSGFDPSSISVAHLLTHTSGIPDLGIGGSCAVGAGALAQYFSSETPLVLWTPPGAVWNYSNRGFSVAGWIIESITGERFEDVVAREVLAPAQMSSATYDPILATAGDHARGLSTSGNTHEPDSYDCEATRPPDGILATPTDYAHFAEALLGGGGGVLSPSSVAALTSPHADTDQRPDGGEGYGYGLFVRSNYKGVEFWHHDGDDPGFRSVIWMAPDRGFAVVLFYDAQARSPVHVAQRTIDRYLALEDVSQPAPTTPPSAWAKYTGQYLDPYNLGAITVTEEGDTLRVSAPADGVENATLTQSAGDAFTATLGEKSGTVTFYPGADGAPAWFVTRLGVGARVE